MLQAARVPSYITVIFQEARRPLLLKWSGLRMIIRQGPWSQSLYSAVQFQARTCPLWEPRTILVWVPGPLGIVSYVNGNGHSPGDTWTRTQKETSQMPSQQSASLSTMLHLQTLSPDCCSFSISSSYLKARTTESPTQGRGSLHCYQQRAA